MSSHLRNSKKEKENYFMGTFKDLFEQATENVSFILVSILIVAVIFMIAYLAERLIQKKNSVKEKIFTTRKIAMIGMFSAISGVLMLFEFPLPMIAPPFYELDFSELPVLICGYAFGPVAGVITEFLKILIKLCLKSTSTAFVGDLANFIIGCTMILPATIIYHVKKSKKNAIISCVVGTLCMTIFGTAFNAIYLIPAFAKLYGMPLEVIIGMGTKINASISGIVSFVVICVAPINLIKGTVLSILTNFIYKPLSPIIKEGHRKQR